VSEEKSKKVDPQTPEIPRQTDREATQQIILVDTSQINVPKERVTSVWTPEQEEEFEKSVKAKGILEPVQLLRIEGALWLTDGLHRLLIAEKIKVSKVPAIIKDGSLEDLLIENLIRNRQRGKSNPAQEADVLDYLVRIRGFPLENAAKQIGLSEDWAKKLLKIATLPDQIKDYLKRGEIPVTGAFYIADLSSAADQLDVAKDAVTYGYTAYQIKARVTQKLNPDFQPAEGETTFTQNGKPTKIPIRCAFCGEELPEGGKGYIWVHGECEQLAHSLFVDYQKALTSISETRTSKTEPNSNPEQQNNPENTPK
jgi:ParB family chromosome partitioning protein